MKSYNIILSNAPLQNGNRGCGALTISTLYLIDKIFASLNVDYKVYLSDAQINTWGFCGKVSVLGKDIHVIPCTYNTPISVSQRLKIGVKKVLKFILRKPIEKDYFKDADFILNIGQGDSFSDIYGVSRFEQMNRAYVIARNLNVPYCVLPQTIGPFSNQQLETEARISMERASMVMVRDKQSFDFIKKIAPAVRIKEYIDVAFFLPYEKIIQNNDFIHVGLNVSALLWAGGYTRNNQFELKCNYKTLVISIIRKFLSIPNVKLHLVSHVVEPVSCIENDYEVSYEIWKNFEEDNLVLAPFPLSPIDCKSYISGLDFFVGARMHATIAAFSSGVPVVPMAYSRKFNGLFEDTLSYSHIVDMKILKEEEIVAVIMESFEKRSDLKNIIEIRNNTIVKERGEDLEKDLIKFFKLL